MLSRDDILAASDLLTEEVPVPEWGGTVRVQGMTASQRDDYEGMVLDQSKGWANARIRLRNIRGLLVARCLVDEQGNRLFRDEQAGEIGAKSAKAVDRLFAVAQRLSGLSEEDIEELVQDFADAPVGSSDSE